MRIFFLLLPWLELFTLIQLGIETSALTALVYVFLTLAVGLAIVRRQGFGIFQRLRATERGGIITPDLLMDDMALGLAGLLLMIPGLITDLAALVVMFGPLRRALARRFFGPQPPRDPDSDVQGDKDHTTIEGSWRRLDD